MAILNKLGPQRLLATSPGFYHDSAKPTALPNGTIAAVTARQYGEDSGVFRLQFRDSQTHILLASKTLDFAATGTGGMPLITALADGHVLLTWTSAFNPTSGTSVWMQEFDGAGQAIGEASQVSPLGLTAGLESVTALPDGGVIISWRQFTQTANPSALNWNVHAREVDMSGNMGDAFRLNATNNGAEGGSRVAVHADGSFAALWVKDESINRHLVLRNFDANGLPTGAERVLASVTETSVNDPSLIALSDGSILAIWHVLPYGDDPSITPQRDAHFVWLNAAGTAEVLAFSPDTDAEVHNAQALQLNDGRLFLSWSELTYSEFGALVTRMAAFVTAAGEVSEPLLLIPQVATISAETSVIELADGRLAVSWAISDEFGTTDTALQIFDPREAAISLVAADGTAVSWMGTAFADTLTGGAGSDRISGGNGADRLFGMAGNDVLSGGAGNDVIKAGAGDDLIGGAAGNDLIYGGGGQDRLNGGGGNDTLWGNAGVDHFVLTPQRGRDEIMDFTNGVDLIDLTAFGYATFGDALAAFSTTAEGAVFSNGTSQALFVGLTMPSLDAFNLLI